jgi:hypothetical protein
MLILFLPFSGIRELSHGQEGIWVEPDTGIWHHFRIMILQKIQEDT